MSNKINECWECFLCSLEDDFDNEPSGYLSNYHPLCLNCANDIYYNLEGENRFRLTFHIEFGDLIFFEKQLIPIENQRLN